MFNRPNPIYSTREDEPDLEDDLHAFVVGLGESVDHLQDAEGTGDFKQLGQLLEPLAAASERLGYPGLAELARATYDACKDEDEDAVQEALIELTEISRRVRLGHRGAA
jgi:hypothetical protein